MVLQSDIGEGSRGGSRISEGGGGGGGVGGGLTVICVATWPRQGKECKKEYMQPCVS